MAKRKADEQRPRIRNSTAEFLIFTGQDGADGIEVRHETGTFWLTQKLMAALFDVDVRTVSEHLQNILAVGELQAESAIRKFRNTAADGKSYLTQFYNLDAIISVGYRVNSTRATQFRQWATAVLRDFAIMGYVLDRKRMENGESPLQPRSGLRSRAPGWCLAPTWGTPSRPPQPPKRLAFSAACTNSTFCRTRLGVARRPMATAAL